MSVRRDGGLRQRRRLRKRYEINAMSVYSLVNDVLSV